ncbi:crustacyanin-A1 subunit-like [Macrobrachium rosenbergii]|uniref:crustacyanin-A1 subunit-like n=1 Tax=Macrobrachium rosenbergii TaxID=79674 RepID=UPI0034D5CF23
MSNKSASVLRAAVLLLAAATLAYATDRPKFLVEGRCPIVDIPTGFDNSRFSGTWYRIGGLRNAEEKSVNCTIYNYQLTGSGFNVISNGVLSDFSPVSQSSSLTQKTPGLAQFTTTIRGKFDAEMVVVSTDYSAYACVFTCYNFRESHKAQFAWILSRTTSLPKEKIAECQVALRKVGVPIAQLRGTYQGSNCSH